MTRSVWGEFLILKQKAVVHTQYFSVLQILKLRHYASKACVYTHKRKAKCITEQISAAEFPEIFSSRTPLCIEK